MSEYRIGFIGAGSMGGAIASGLVSSGKMAAERVMVSDPDASKRAAMLDEYGIQGFATSDELFAQDPEVVVLAIKPQILVGYLEQNAPGLAGRLVVSIAAGVPVATLERLLPESRVIRVMPNLPIKVLCGASAVAPGASLTPEDLELVLDLFGSLGVAKVMREDQVDVAGQSVGCSPALFSLMIDCLTRAAVRRGMAASDAREMFEMVMLGTAKMLSDSGEHPRAFMEKVTSPGGTTIQYLRALEPHMAAGCEEGIDAAMARNAELAGN
ncbi:MAG: pyrroline-5-carboxylate reductase [Atopobiaceae bacterium]|nr:pyrroline-5-carboxylate reductase [Atopobiaceae bacterium]